MIFGVGTALSLTLSALVVWVGSRENLHGHFFDQETGEWDLWYVAFFSGRWRCAWRCLPCLVDPDAWRRMYEVFVLRE